MKLRTKTMILFVVYRSIMEKMTFYEMDFYFMPFGNVRIKNEYYLLSCGTKNCLYFKWKKKNSLKNRFLSAVMHTNVCQRLSYLKQIFQFCWKKVDNNQFKPWLIKVLINQLVTINWLRWIFNLRSSF
jgi:hypothetical protein